MYPGLPGETQAPAEPQTWNRNTWIKLRAWLPALSCTILPPVERLSSPGDKGDRGGISHKCTQRERESRGYLSRRLPSARPARRDRTSRRPNRQPAMPKTVLLHFLDHPCLPTSGLSGLHLTSTSRERRIYIFFSLTTTTWRHGRLSNNDPAGIICHLDVPCTIAFWANLQC